tara:strand:- start:183 stop:422 length:240 start_codon:yes stop_codon:yes gene_type:complete
MSKIVGQSFKIGDRVLKKNNNSSSNGFNNSPIYGHIIEVCHEPNNVKRYHYYYWIKHENTGKRSKHIQHRLKAAPLPPQ